jgi:alkylation response protein AidB-like acyl-CoA dehydrogenase
LGVSRRFLLCRRFGRSGLAASIQDFRGAHGFSILIYAMGGDLISLEAVRGWLDENWDVGITLAEWWDRLADAGYAFPSWPHGFGGSAASLAEARTITSALAEAQVIGPPMGNATSMGAPTLLEHGTDEQKERFVGPAVRGREAWAQLFSEPGAGSDLASLSTSAVLDGDEYVINGQKVWNSYADIASWGMLLARTDPNVPKHQGITFMMIDMNQPGVEVRRLVQMNGTADFCEVFMTDARVPTVNVIGQPGSGWRVARTTLAYERSGISSGRARGFLHVQPGTKAGNLERPVGELMVEARRAAKEGSRRGEVLLNARSMLKLAQEKGVAHNGALRDRLMRYYIDSQVYKWTGQRSRDNLKSGRPGPESSTLKVQLAMLAHQSRDLSMSILGAEGMLVGDGTTDRGRVQMAALSSYAASLGGGTNEIQRNIIGERSLGLPREPVLDSEVPFREARKS